MSYLNGACGLWVYGDRVAAAINLTEDELAVDRAAITDAALTAARQAATHRLVQGMTGLAGALAEDTEPAITAALTARDTTTYGWLSVYERPWSLLVLRLLAGTVSDLTAPVAEARARGATVAEIAAALGMSPQGVYASYADQVVRRRRAVRQSD